MEPVFVALPAFHVVGISFSASLQEMESQQLGKKAYRELLSRAGEISGKTGDDVYLIQIYPDKPDFDAQVDAFTQVIGFQVSYAGSVPSGMTAQEVPAHEYMTVTHKGLESELGATYGALYGKWLPESGRRFGGYDLERWDHRYRPDDAENEIDVYVAVR